MTAADNNTADKTSIASSIASIGKEARDDVHSAIDQAADKVKPVVENVAKSVHAGVEKVGDTVEAASDKVVEGGKQFSATCQQWKDTGSEYVRGNPVVSLLVAAVAGYGLSKLVGARSK